MATAPSEGVVVVGAGLAGSLAALFLRRRGDDVTLMDLRSDPRAAAAVAASAATDGGLSLLANASKRSINLALSSRGLRALRKLGLADEVLRDAVIMRGRMIHAPNGRTELQPYGTTDEEVLNSVSREAINRFLLERLSAPPEAGEGRVELCFKHKVVGLGKDGSLTVLDTADGGAPARTVRPRFIIGADGSFSVVRRELSKLCRLSLRHEYIEHGYLELSIPARPAGGRYGNGFALEPHALHIWPRHDFMLIALPNRDGSFTGTLFASWTLLEQLEDPAVGLPFFREHFADALAVMPDLAQELTANPRGALATVRCDPWHAAGRVLLIGDAAHAVVPFYGQGMNAAFEDCLALDQALDEARHNVPKAIASFYTARKPACDALADLSLQNYVEMRSKTASRLFVLKNSLDAALHRWVPSWQPSLHTAVTFSPMPYHVAKARCEWQDSLLGTAFHVSCALVGIAGVALALKTSGASARLGAHA
ncbi:hypothetical protein KFE25_006178 [Diacronema lutheri]|uniref:Kynurenine 3-monooxygenase n=1 Tax=Diacronema lutheri TaxID=2081491 RepID=A0A8J5XQE0_DIALT|nr:hypothetical protein KFE25_006178 [Diacronema lutheri]